MKTMLDKIGIIGDVKTAFNRLGIDTLAVVCVGGSSGTAVKVVTCDTVGGVYTDFLILKADALNINEGFCFSLIGAKKFVKITGCDNAIGIVGDCDYDVKQVTFNTVTIAGADLENNKAQTINVSTYTEPVVVTPTAGKDGMKKATVTLSNIPSPSGKVNAYAWYDGERTYYFDIDIAPSSKEDFFSAQVIDVSYNKVLSVVGMEVVFNINYDYQKTDDTHFSAVSEGGASVTVTRDATKDITLW